MVSPETVQGLPQQVAVTALPDVGVPVTAYVASAPFSSPSVNLTVTAVPVFGAGVAVMVCGWYSHTDTQSEWGGGGGGGGGGG
eukprot:COSAG03_NODE_717_length_6119_cov_44.906645_4_plen_82_part_01